ncbi:hypothetical protein [Streptomyces sp. TE33382]
MIEIVHDYQDHHEDCTYATSDDECRCAELTLDEAWPQEPDGA